MANSLVVKTWVDGTITIKDGTGTPISLSVRFEDGNLQLGGLGRKLREATPHYARGRLVALRYGNAKPVSFSFSAMMSEFTSATATSLMDAVMWAGAFASGVGTRGANEEVKTHDVVYASEGTNFGDSADHTFTMEDCYLEIDFAEGDPNKFTVNGICYGAMTGDVAATAF